MKMMDQTAKSKARTENRHILILGLIVSVRWNFEFVGWVHFQVRFAT
jgi:hypothetical protein